MPNSTIITASLLEDFCEPHHKYYKQVAFNRAEAPLRCNLRATFSSLSNKLLPVNSTRSCLLLKLNVNLVKSRSSHFTTTKYTLVTVLTESKQRRSEEHTSELQSRPHL